GESIKAAVQNAGISEQTYYHWKRAAGQTTQSDELKDLVKLEEENARLKKLLADRLRKENAELRKKLGLA
ncbi:MAG: transcriptional regulator, partial [Mesorhizobium sp.]